MNEVINNKKFIRFSELNKNFLDRDQLDVPFTMKNFSEQETMIAEIGEFHPEGLYSTRFNL